MSRRQPKGDKMRVLSFEKLKEKRNREQDRRRIEATQFVVDAWNIAVEHERFLPKELALKLVRQIMVDHGIKVKELKSGSHPDTE